MSVTRDGDADGASDGRGAGQLGQRRGAGAGEELDLARDRVVGRHVTGARDVVEELDVDLPGSSRRADDRADAERDRVPARIRVCPGEREDAVMGAAAVEATADGGELAALAGETVRGCHGVAS